MKLSELVGKQIVNIYDGVRLGTIGESDLIIHTESGEIESIIVPNRENIFSMWIDKSNLTIPWTSVKKIGQEVIIVELDSSHSSARDYSM